MGESIQELKDKLALACRIIINENLTDRGKGHQCVRVPGKDEIILPGHVHDVGRGLEGITADDMVVIDFNGKVLDGKYPESMGEYHFYVAALRRRPDVQSCLHIHPFYANLIGIAKQKLLPVSRDGCFFPDGVPIHEEFPLYVGEPRLGDRLAQRLGKNGKAVLHRAHGAFVVGRSIEDCLLNAISLEKAAQFQVWASMMGKLKPFTKQQLRGFKATVSEHIFAESFAYFANKVK
jgi:ribulose-5-phosphate 4-epimerase/fuculose-1-phosphate aldolase